MGSPRREPSLFEEATTRRPDLSLERSYRRRGFTAVAGVDEAGRGPLAGPVVACAVLLADGHGLDGVDDSKALSPLERQALYLAIFRRAQDVGLGIASHHVVDRVNILRATLIAMRRAVRALRARIDLTLVDGRDPIPGRVLSVPIVRGDQRSLSIAAASIVAKVTRDLLMIRYDREFPGYGFAAHKGYPTPDHRDAIRRLGPCPIHRSSFRLLAEETESISSV